MTNMKALIVFREERATVTRPHPYFFFINCVYDMGGYLLDMCSYYSSGALSYIGQTCLPTTRGWFSVGMTAL